MDLSRVTFRALGQLVGLQRCAVSIVFVLSFTLAPRAEATVDFNLPNQGPPNQNSDLLRLDCDDFGDLHDQAYELAQELAPPGLQDENMPHCVVLSPGLVMQWLDDLGIDEQHPLYSQLPAELFDRPLPFVAICCGDQCHVPEPASLLIWGTLTGLGACWYRRRRANPPTVNAPAR